MTAALAMVRYTVVVSLSGPRRWVLGAVAGLVVLLGYLASTIDGSATMNFAGMIDAAYLGVVVPLAALVLADAAMAAELRRGTFSLTWLSPVPFASILISRWVGAAVIAAGSLGGAGMVAAYAAGNGRDALATGITIGAVSAGYVAVFVLIGVLTSRSTVWALGWIFLVDQLLGAAITGLAQFSPSWLGRQMYGVWGTDAADLIRDGLRQGAGALGQLLVITALALALASWRTAHIRLGGGPD